MSAETLLQRLDGVRSTGRGRWIARCAAHNDKRPSLSIRELDDGRVLLHDFGGCSVGEVLAAVGLDATALFPPRPSGGHAARPERRPFPAADVLSCLAEESLLVAIAAERLSRGERLDDATRDRLARAAARLHAGVDVASGVARRG